MKLVSQAAGAVNLSGSRTLSGHFFTWVPALVLTAKSTWNDLQVDRIEKFEQLTAPSIAISYDRDVAVLRCAERGESLTSGY